MNKSKEALLPKLPGFFREFFPALVLVVGIGTICPAFGQVQTSDRPANASPTVQAPAATPAGDAKPDVAKNAGPQSGSPADAPKTEKAPSLSNGEAAPSSTTGGGSSLIPHDLSPYGMFMNADIVVKAVMVGLALASVITWTVLLAKTIELIGARRRARKALDAISAAPTLRDAADSLGNAKAPVTRLVNAALAEAEQSSGLPAEGVKERAAALLSRLESRAGRAIGRGTGLLATIGSTAPFVGLFGTVWGIMNSFIGISKTNTTNLAVVAPGIAEALLATAFGLVAAIPAVVIYNFFARNITGYRSILGDASTEIMRLLSRDLDRNGAPDGARVMPMGRAAE